VWPIKDIFYANRAMGKCIVDCKTLPRSWLRTFKSQFLSILLEDQKCFLWGGVIQENIHTMNHYFHTMEKIIKILIDGRWKRIINTHE
jgi:hypothetical protein